MANGEQVKMLKQGVEGWNKWREENPDIKIDLGETDLSGTDFTGACLHGADLRGTDLSEVYLSKADLRVADLREANLREAHLNGTDLSGAYLEGALLTGTDLSKANLSGANLFDANLRKACLIEAKLWEADLWDADFRKADLRKADLRKAKLYSTVFGNIDLSETKGLEIVEHSGPSTIATDTLELSKGKIPEIFLRGCGLSDVDIEYAKIFREGIAAKDMDDILYRIHDLRFSQALQINPLFISYSHKDGAFVDVIEKHLDKKGIRFWRDIHDATAGRLEKVVDRAMRMNPTVLLVLSENSTASDWVEHEARTGRELEKVLERDVLCPLALDEAWKDCKWPARLREQIMEYNILDFSHWKDEAEFEKMFRKLIDGLDLFYKEK